ncbi:hypothetical protein HispidOSU_013420 [Sigmodon hispidus]
MGAGAARPSSRCRCRPGLIHTPLSARAGGEQFPWQDPGKKKKGQNDDRFVLTVKTWRASRLTPSSCFGGGRRSRSAPGLHREPLGSVGLQAGSRAAGDATGGTHCSPEPRCARRASEQHREPPLPCAAPSPRDAPQPGAGTRACSRGSRGARSA